MPKLRRVLSLILALWLCVMLITFTYTWVSRNWTPSIQGDNINIASSGALVISILSDTDAVHPEVSLNDVVGLEVDKSFTFRQVSSQDGITFFYKDFSPTVDGNAPALSKKIVSGDTHAKDYIDTRFCLKLDETVDQDKYIFIHPETMIEKINLENPIALNQAIRISLTYEKISQTEAGNTLRETKTVILADLADNTNAINFAADRENKEYRAVKPDADGKTDEEASGALGYQTVYGLHYFDCGRGGNYNFDDPESNYSFTRDADRALFTMSPGDTVWIDMRIWLEGEDGRCVKEIAGESFNMVLKFDSAFVKQPTNEN